MMALPGEKGVKGRGRERERTLCNFLCWLGGLGEKVVISVENKKDCMICTDMSEFVICLKKRKRKSKMKKKNRPTHETERSLSLTRKKKHPHPSISLSLLLQNKNLNHDHHQFHILATSQQQQSHITLRSKSTTPTTTPYKSPLLLTSTHNAGFSQTKKTF